MSRIRTLFAVVVPSMLVSLTCCGRRPEMCASSCGQSKRAPARLCTAASLRCSVAMSGRVSVSRDACASVREV